MGSSFLALKVQFGGFFKIFGRFFKIKVKIIKGYLDVWKFRWLLKLNVYDLPKDLRTSINFGFFLQN